MNKVTAITFRNNRKDVLLFRHENAGIQMPAGTVEGNEEIIDAAIRELHAETGIRQEQIMKAVIIPFTYNELKPDEVIIESDAFVYSRPRDNSFNWIKIKRGITANIIKEDIDYSFIEYREWNDEITKEYYSYEIAGWIKNTDISKIKTRHFVIFDVEETRNEWEVFIDCHLFKPFFVETSKCPPLVGIQDHWRKIMLEYIDIE